MKGNKHARTHAHTHTQKRFLITNARDGVIAKPSGGSSSQPVTIAKSFGN